MSDPTGIDSGAPALLLTTSRALTAADPTAIDSGAPALLLTTSRMNTNEVPDGTSAALSYGGQTVNACAVAAVTPVGPRSAASGGIASQPVKHPIKRPVKQPVEHGTKHGATHLTRPMAPERTLAFTGQPSFLADAAFLALGGALWLSRRIRSADDPN